MKAGANGGLTRLESSGMGGGGGMEAGRRKAGWNCRPRRNQESTTNKLVGEIYKELETTELTELKIWERRQDRSL